MLADVSSGGIDITSMRWLIYMMMRDGHIHATARVDDTMMIGISADNAYADGRHYRAKMG